MTNGEKLQLVPIVALALLLASALGRQPAAAEGGPKLVRELRLLKPAAAGRPAEYLPGEPILLQLRVTNIGGAPAGVQWDGWPTRLVPYSGQKPLARRNHGEIPSSREKPRSLQAGASFRGRTDLTLLYVFPQEGAFAVRWAHGPPIRIAVVRPSENSPPWERAYKALRRAKNLALGVGTEVENHLSVGTQSAVQVLTKEVIPTRSYLREWGYYY
ncbi:MAG: hypothetical protein ACE5R4_18140, partial [Armatimonadota bacterium]